MNSGELNRRRLLGMGAATLLLAGCGAGGRRNLPGAAPAGPPRPGGTLRVGALGTAAAVSRDPLGAQPNDSDYLILSLIYDTLTVPAAAPIVAPRLATGWTSSPDLRRWRFELANARFHDGTPMSADDVVWSLRTLRESPLGSSRLPGIDPANIIADGPRAVVLQSDYPNSDLPELVRLTTFVVKQNTADRAGAPGTGPFRLDWFRDGNARLARNEHWYGPRPWLDAIEVRMFERPDAMANAVLSGELDLASNVGTTAARAAQGQDGIQLVRRANDMALPVVLRTADGPYADPRVREAFRLAVDRDAMVRQVLGGYGTVANDVLGTADPAYARDLPQRRQNLARAKELLDQARFDRSQRYPLLTSEDVPGLAESATLFANQLQRAGVHIDVLKQESSTFLGEARGKAPLYTSYWGTNDSVVFCAGKLMLSGSTLNEAAWHDPAFDNAYRTALATPDPVRRKGLLHQLQQIEYDRSGYLLWGMADGMDLARNTVQNLPRLPGYGRVLLDRTWLSG